MGYPDAYELLDLASNLGLERKIPVNLSTICSILDINIIQGRNRTLGSIDINVVGKIEINPTYFPPRHLCYIFQFNLGYISN